MNSEKPLVSIICHCFNHSKFILETLKSVLNQTYNNIEIIVVDDFSTDNSADVISSFIVKHPEIKFIQNQRNLGITKSFNRTLKKTKGKYIIDLAADDLLLPNCVMEQVHCFQNSYYQNLGIVYGNAELISENGNFEDYFFEVNSNKKVIKKRPTGRIYESIITSGKTFCSVSGMVKKEVFDSLNGYDELLEYEDFDFWIRASRNFDIDFIDAPLIQKRIVANSLGSNFFKKTDARAKRMNHSTFLILKKALALNQTKEEDLALQKRINYEIVHTFKMNDFRLFFKNLGLRIVLYKRRLIH
ncbi:glycosyltransferase family 2 protein [Flavobacterium sp. RSSA_27]|uniref:glycosyltransferase family 2 protein n=1 Tax=Flavobacterium sp. RSSA_27 TaxID=3447667 RepID=UPI003F3CBC62